MTDEIRPFTIDTTDEQLDDRSEEFPRVDERLTGRRHRYSYAATDWEAADGRHGGVAKHDVVAGTAEVLDLGAGSGANELVFVPRSPDAAEDDGWLVGYTYVPERDASDLVVVAASDVTAGPVARVHLPVRVPFGFHGNWFPTS